MDRAPTGGDCGGGPGEGGWAEVLDRVGCGSGQERVQSAREIRRLTKTSSRNRRLLAGAVEPLVAMLGEESAESNEAAILALLNLAVKDESNKIKIIAAGALDPLVYFLRSPDSNLQEYATAALLTLSASPSTKPTIASTAAIPLLVQVLRDGSPQAKADATTTLYNLSTTPNTFSAVLSSDPVPSLISLLRTCKKSSKTVEKCTALLEQLMDFSDARTALTAEPGGVLAVVEAVEDGSSLTREHAVGALLTLCQSDPRKYKDVILSEGAIPGLLEVTVQGTGKARVKARLLLELLRAPGSRGQEVNGETLEEIVSGIVCGIEGDEKAGKAKRMVAEMVKVSMEQSMRHLERRASALAAVELQAAPPMK